MRRQIASIAKTFGIAGLVVVSACSSQYLLVPKADIAAAEQCLRTQQSLAASSDAQSRQLRETQALMEQLVAQQQESDELLRGVLGGEAPTETREVACPGGAPTNLGSNDTALDKQIVGASEWVLFPDLGVVLSARMDTAAAMAVLDARDIELFERNSEEWVRFNLHNPETGELLQLERKRKVGVHRSRSGDQERRPVIELRLTVGQVTQVAEFVLADRSRQEFPVLIGRNILRDLMLVDVSRTNITEPRPAAQGNGLELD